MKTAHRLCRFAFYGRVFWISFMTLSKAINILLMFVMNVLSVSVSAQASIVERPASSNHSSRIASLNLCVDALLLKFVEPTRIVSLTQLSENAQFSPFYLQAKHFPKHVGLAEQIVNQNPDLVLAGEFGAADAKQLLVSLGYPVVTLNLPRRLADISDHVREFGRLTGKQVETNIFAQEIERDLAQLTQVASQQRPVGAFWYASNGVVVGEGTLENELMSAAGFYNLAKDFKLQGFATLDLELLLQAKPEVIIVESSDARAYSLASEYLTHPALTQNQIKIVELPKTLSVCIAPIADQVLKSLLQQRLSLQTQSK